MNADDFYNLVFNRRDVRGEYLPDPVDTDVLARILNAAHHAPSVGYSQPWNFILVREESIRRAIHREFEACRQREAAHFDGERRHQYDRLRLEGILTAPVNICVTCDRSRAGPAVLGRTQQPDTDIYSTVCAIQNLWLAARIEGLGLGWVSILRPKVLKDLFALPPAVEPIAYLCLGHVSEFHARPELEIKGWRNRLPLENLLWLNQWGETRPEDALLASVRRLQSEAEK
ncbi:MAG: 5,6-dimethylbenzimidazole synthase [Porticoccaceae bacterium]|nr:5,6-dimethylbenzimidazole synthase [Porticoccaceae bacterium]